MKKLYFSLASLLVLNLGFSQTPTNTKIQNKPLNNVGSTQANPIFNSNNNGPNTFGVTVDLSNQNHPGHDHCPTHSKTQAHFEEMGVWTEYQQSYNTGVQNNFATIGQPKTPGSNTIAVIFHVVHEGEPIGTGTNVSYADIMAVFNDLVEDFSLTNADQVNARTGLGFNPANTGINFCLATQDPMGVPLTETGVTRYQTTETWFDPDDPAEENAMKSAPLGSDIWDRDDYLNVWICDISNGAGSGTAGYAYVPSTSFLPNPSVDGIVIDYNLGVNNDNVLTHEVGHYLGLYHTWGSGGCTIGTDDGFTDTPLTDGPSFNYSNSCNFGSGQQTCSGIETQFENYMDYSNCTCMFTTEQANYMLGILQGVRSSLLLSPGCDPAGPPVCDFTSFPAGPGPVIIPENGTVVFSDASTGAPTSWAWTISGTQGVDWDYTGGTNANSQNPEVTFYNIGTYDITLVATNGFGSCTGYTENSYVQVVAPAAGTDCDTLRNWDPADAALNGYYTYNPNPGGWGSFPGHYDFDGTNFYAYQYAEELTYAGTAEVRRLQFPVFTVHDANGTGTVVFKVYDNDNGGLPGTVLATETVLISDLNDFAWNTVDFTTPASITGTFFAGAEVFYGAPQDTVQFGMTATITGGVDDVWADFDVIGWGEYGFAGSWALDVMLSNGPAPVADMQFSEAAVCPGGDIVVNGSGSTNTTDYEWFQTDDPVTTIYATSTNAGATFNFPGPAGNYNIFLFADGSCQTDGLVLPVVVNPAVGVSVSVTNTTCGDNNGSVTITGSGGDGTYEYSLDGTNWQTGNTYNNLPAGTYTAYVRTNGDACEAQMNFTINGSVPLSGSVSPAASGICPGGNVNLTASGGTIYTWYDGATVIGNTATINVTPTVQTQYTVEISDGTCTDIQYATVNVYPLPPVDAGVDQTVCDGASVTLTGSGAVSYSWDNGVNDGVPFTASTTTTYTVTGTDGNGCQNTDQVTVTVNPLPTVSAGADAAICNGNSTTITASGASTYSWDQGLGAGASHSVSPASTTTYTVTGTDGNGCINTDAVTITVNALPTVNAGADAAICNGNSTTITATGASTYSWDQGLGAGASHSVSPGSTTTYTVTGTDGNGCINTDAVTITVNVLPTVDAGVDQTVCNGDMVTLSGSGASSYSWDNGVTDGVPFAATTTTTYTVTGTDGNGCQNTDNVTVTVNPLPTTSGLTETCNGTNTAYEVSFDVTGGTSPYTVTGESGSFAGSTWTSVFIPTGNSYSLTITDANGCAATPINGSHNCSCTTDAGTMQTAPAITVCGTGAATATHNGDQVFDGDDVMQFIIHDNAGASLGTTFGTSGTPSFSFGGGMVLGTTYYISAVAGNDAGGGVVDLADPCLSVSAGTPVTWYALPTVDAGVDQTVCENDMVTLSGSGASSYSWTGGITNNTPFAATTTTTYTVTGTDGNGCQNTDNVTVTVNALPTVDAGADASICIGNSTTITATGASTYSWDQSLGAGASHSVSPTANTTYTVTGTDGNGCVNTDAVTITVNALPTVNAGTDQTVCAGDMVTMSGSGASSYTWDNGVTDGVAFAATATTTYTVTGTDVNGCQNTDQVTVTVNALPIVDAGPDQSVCEGASVTLSGSGATSYTWDNGVSNNVPFTPAVGTTTYTVTGTNVNGCQNTDQVDVTVNALPTVDAGADQTVCQNDMVTLSGSGATSYTWDNGVTDGTPFTATVTTVYTVTGTDGNGCQNTDQVNVNVNVAPTVDAGTDTTICGSGMITFTGSGAVSYTWDNGVTDGVPFNVTATTTFTVTGTDANGCTATDQITVTVGAGPSVTGVVTHDSGSSDGAIDVTITGGGQPYTISWDSGQTTEDISGLAAGDYTITVTDTSGCTVQATFTVLSTVGVDENLVDNNLSIYPNPSLGQFTIALEGKFDYEITDSRGRLIITNYSNDKEEIDLSAFEAGVYFIRVQQDGQMAIRKLILQ